MLTELEHLPITRPVFGHRTNALVPHSLPDASALMEVSLREMETAGVELQSQLQSLHLQPATGLLDDEDRVDHARQNLRDIAANYLEHLNLIQERIETRHHPHGRFGSAIARLQTEIKQQIDELTAEQEQLGELCAEQNVELAEQRLFAIEAQLRSAPKKILDLVQDIRKGERQPHSITLGGQHSPHERSDLRDKLGWSLGRWWQMCTVQPGPMTIALIDLHRLASDYPELSRSAAEQLLNAAAGLVVSDRRSGRAGTAIDTMVISAEGEERQLAWSCAVIEEHGQVHSIIAAGVDKTNSKPAKASHQQKTTGSPLSATAATLSDLSDAERRRKQRTPFPYVQLIAPLTGMGLPPTSAFFEALCHDISEDGFSFLSGTMPTSTSLVVALGTRAPHLYMTARVAHFTRCDTISGPKYIVGCQFTGRAMVMAQFA
jgi:hypothetical protein